jgi:hypothetical protein
VSRRGERERSFPSSKSLNERQGKTERDLNRRKKIKGKRDEGSRLFDMSIYKSTFIPSPFTISTNPQKKTANEGGQEERRHSVSLLLLFHPPNVDTRVAHLAALLGQLGLSSALFTSTVPSFKEDYVVALVDERAIPVVLKEVGKEVG